MRYVHTGESTQTTPSITQQSPANVARCRGPFRALSVMLCAIVAFISHSQAASAEQVVRNVHCVDFVSTGDRIDMLVGKPIDDKGRTGFYYQRSTDGGESWSDPVRVDPANGESIAKHGRGHDARLAVNGDALTAIWTLKADGPMGSGPLATAWSTDGGATWHQGGSPSGVAPETGARFPAIVATTQAVHTVWIHAIGQRRSLHASASDDQGKTWSKPIVVDHVICACCWNTLRVDAKGNVFALYRNHDRSDMHMAVRDTNGQWRLKGAVGAFEWQFEGCPHVGGGLALSEDDADKPPELVATVWTGEPTVMGAYVTLSRDRGDTWSKPAPLVDMGMWKGQRTDTAASGKSALVVYDNVEGNVNRVLARVVDNDGTLRPTFPLSDARHDATHPRVVATAKGWLVGWTQRSDNGESLDLILKHVDLVATPLTHRVETSGTLTADIEAPTFSP